MRPKLYPAAVIGWPQPGCGWLQSARRVKLSLKLGGVRGLGCKVTDEYAAWFTALIKQDLGSATQVAQAVAALREEGPTLGRPLVDRLKATKIHHLKNCDPDREDDRRSGSSAPSTPPGRRCCSRAATRRATGHAGTATTSPLAEQLYIDYTADEEE